MVEIIKNISWFNVFALYLIWPGVQQAILFFFAENIAKFGKKVFKIMLIPGILSIAFFAICCYKVILPAGAGNEDVVLILAAINTVAYAIFMVTTLKLGLVLAKERAEKEQVEDPQEKIMKYYF